PGTSEQRRIPMAESRFREGEILLQAALTTAVEADLPASAARTLNNLAVVYESRDRYADALAMTERGLEYYRRMGNRVGEQSLLAGSISTLVLVGRWDDAYARMEEVQDPDAAVVAFSEDLHVVEIACWRGQIDRAREHLQRYADSDVAQAGHDFQHRIAYALHDAMVARMEGDA